MTPPDEKGYCSLGVCASYLVAAIGNVPNIIAEINPNMPHTFGAKVHVDDIQYIIEADYVPSRSQNHVARRNRIPNRAAYAAS